MSSDKLSKQVREDLEFISKNIPKIAEGLLKAQSKELIKSIKELEKLRGKVN
tara:strand:+ start:537 stop:692 length:156 start_codon:yes stop_codon:yes gene_type:complete